MVPYLQELHSADVASDSRRVVFSSSSGRSVRCGSTFVGKIRFVRQLGLRLILVRLGEFNFHSGVSRVQHDAGGLSAFL